MRSLVLGILLLLASACGKRVTTEQEGCLPVGQGAPSGEQLCTTAVLTSDGRVTVTDGDESFSNKMGYLLRPSEQRELRFFANKLTCLIVDARTDEQVYLTLSNDNEDAVIVVQGHDPLGDADDLFDIARVAPGESFLFAAPPQGVQAEQFGYGHEGQVFFWLHAEPAPSDQRQ